MARAKQLVNEVKNPKQDTSHGTTQPVDDIDRDESAVDDSDIFRDISNMNEGEFAAWIRQLDDSLQ